MTDQAPFESHETKDMHCVICGDDVRATLDTPDNEPVLCEKHWFDIEDE